MYNLIRADLFKLRKSMSVKVLLGITTISSIVMTVIAYLIPQGKIDLGSTGIGFMFSDVNIISILGAVIAGIIICGDFDNKTIQDAIANGYGRLYILASKLIVFCISIGLMLLPYAIITAIALGTGYDFSMGSISVGFLNMMTTETDTVLSVVGIWKLIGVILTLTTVYIGQLSICVPIAIALKKPVFVVAIYYGFTIFCAQLTGLRDSSQIFDKFFACTPYGGNYTFVTMNTGSGELIKAIVVSLIFIILMLSIAYLIFRKSEVK